MKLKTLPPLFKAPTPLVTPSSALPKVTEPYYLTAEHKAWAADVKARSGGVCAHCGKATPRLIADHIVEVRDGGAKTDPANGMALCWSCHGLKTAAARRARNLGR
jgi:5-methylcytosine-specific restriction enzyme A